MHGFLFTKDALGRMDGQWLKITRNLFDSSCDTIKTRILKNMDTVNLNEISVQLHRMGGQDWAQVQCRRRPCTFFMLLLNQVFRRSTQQRPSCRSPPTRPGRRQSSRPTSRYT